MTSSGVRFTRMHYLNRPNHGFKELSGITNKTRIDTPDVVNLDPVALSHLPLITFEPNEFDGRCNPSLSHKLAKNMRGPDPNSLSQ
jgi:hypothetical protein